LYCTVVHLLVITKTVK